jgi:hypothetical protein
MSLDLHDLLQFFEHEPIIDESDVPWEYSGATAIFRNGADEVWCRLAPGEGALAMLWRQGGVKRFELSVEGYSDMKIERIGTVLRFVAASSEGKKEPLVLQLRPHVFVAMGAV